MDTVEVMKMILLQVAEVYTWRRVRRRGNRMEVVLTGMDQKGQGLCQDVRGSGTMIEMVVPVRGEVVGEVMDGGVDEEWLEDGVTHGVVVVVPSSSKLYRTNSRLDISVRILDSESDSSVP